MITCDVYEDATICTPSALNMQGRIGGQRSGVNNWDLTFKALTAAKARIQTMNQTKAFSKPCLDDLAKLKLPDDSLSGERSVRSSDVATKLNSVNIYDGNTSWRPIAEIVNGVPFYGTVGLLFSPNNEQGLSIQALTLGNTQYYAEDLYAMDPNLLAGTLMHETLHSLGFSDTDLENKLIGTGSGVSDTTNIAKLLGTDCFGYRGN